MRVQDINCEIRIYHLVQITWLVRVLHVTLFFKEELRYNKLDPYDNYYLERNLSFDTKYYVPGEVRGN